MPVLEPLDAPQALRLRLAQAGHTGARGVRVVTDAPPPVRRRTARTATPRPAPIHDPSAPPVRGRSALQHPGDAAVPHEVWGPARDPGEAVDAWLDERPSQAPVEDWSDTLEHTLEPALEREMAHEPHEPRRWSVPEDVPQAVLVVPIVLGITIITTVVGMIILF